MGAENWCNAHNMGSVDGVFVRDILLNWKPVSFTLRGSDGGSRSMDDS